MTQIFISYSHVDFPFLEQFAKRLKRIVPKASIWYDDEGLHGGDVWWEEILNAVAVSDLFIYLLSNESVKSEYCQAEFKEARRLQKRIITVQIRDRTELTDDLDDIQYVDMKNGLNDGDAVARLSGAVHMQLDKAMTKEPLWKQRTPKPTFSKPPPRPNDDLDTDTPPLNVRPTAPSISAKEGALPKMMRDAMIALTVTVVGGVIVVLFQMWLQSRDSSLPIPTSTSVSQLNVTSVIDWTPVERDFNGVTMLQVPAGCFMMGSENGEEDEKPVNKQCFDNLFWIDKYEVTNAQFETFNGMAANPSNWTDAMRPREMISWFEASDFCIKRGGRLPTEREWEYAARGPDNLAYPWGTSWNANNIVWRNNAKGQTANVGSYLAGASWVGALDMSGNVWEWTTSLYVAYPYIEEDGREDAKAIDLRVLRGGSWYHDLTEYFHATARYGANTDPKIDRGFRCVRSS
jgi:formylglycine-generating enzyme required for sulfatase activity